MNDVKEGVTTPRTGNKQALAGIAIGLIIILVNLSNIQITKGDFRNDLLRKGSSAEQTVSAVVEERLQQVLLELRRNQTDQVQQLQSESEERLRQVTAQTSDYLEATKTSQAQLEDLLHNHSLEIERIKAESEKQLQLATSQANEYLEAAQAAQAQVEALQKQLDERLNATAGISEAALLEEARIQQVTERLASMTCAAVPRPDTTNFTAKPIWIPAYPGSGSEMLREIVLNRYVAVDTRQFEIR